jgi:4-hydroxy-3-methylbut-2-enyl diphosphate reductase
MTEDYPECDIVLSEEDIDRLGERPRLGIVAQTTQPIERVRYLVAQIRRRFLSSDVRFVDTVCQPTKQRQHAAVELAQQCDVVVVIGGPNSNNTRELVATCRRHCAQVHHVQGAADLCEEWFFTAGTVGITAGTSTPDALIEGVGQWLKRLKAAKEKSVQNKEATCRRG